MKDAPPFWVWTVAAALALAVLIPASVDAWRFPGTQQTEPSEGLEVLSGAAPGRRVLVLGSSVARSALEPGEMAPWTVAPLTIGSARLSDFLPFGERLRAAKPDIVVIEAGVLLRRPLALKGWERFAYNVQSRLALRPLIRLAMGEKLPEAPAYGRDYAPTEPSALEAYAKSLRLSEYPPSVDADAFLKSLGGAKLMLVEFGRAPEAQAAWPREITDGSRALARLYERRYGMRYVEYPHKPGPGHFADILHYNAEGRVPVTQWLRRSLAAL